MRDDMPDHEKAEGDETPFTTRGPRRVRRRTVVLATAAVLLSIVALLVGGVAALTQTDRGRAVIMRALVPVISEAVGSPVMGAAADGAAAALISAGAGSWVSGAAALLASMLSTCSLSQLLAAAPAGLRT